MGWQEDIDRLRKKAAKTKSKIVLLNIIDKLGESASTQYSDLGIDALCFIIATQKEKDVKIYALDTIDQMRNGKNDLEYQSIGSLLSDIPVFSLSSFRIFLFNSLIF